MEHLRQRRRSLQPYVLEAAAKVPELKPGLGLLWPYTLSLYVLRLY